MMRKSRTSGERSVWEINISDVDTSPVVGADRVLAVLVELAKHPDGATLEELAAAVGSAKPTVHRALSSLRRANLALQPRRGIYLLGDDFLRLAFENYARRPDLLAIEPLLKELAERFRETAHYAVRDGSNIVYRAKVDPSSGAVRLSSFVGGRNPAHCTAVGKLLLSQTVGDIDDLRRNVGKGPLERRTARTITDLDDLWLELQRTRDRGYGIDDQENELGVNCLAVPIRSTTDPTIDGAISVSALSFRLPLDDLINRRGEIDDVLQTAAGLR